MSKVTGSGSNFPDEPDEGADVGDSCLAAHEASIPVNMSAAVKHAAIRINFRCIDVPPFYYIKAILKLPKNRIIPL